ncbi:MAG TPA: TolC family protein, partial [Spirochaetales bacterium]|nr:TolC family protein [Spirochaetales bacterium]
GSYDLALLEALLEAKRGLRDLAEAEAKGRPDIGLRVELSYGGSRLPFVEKDWFGQDDYQLTFSVGTSGNIFGNAVKEGEAAKARARLSEAEAQRADAERSIRAFVRDTWLGMELGRARLEYAALRQDGWAADLAQKRAALRAGGGSESEYLTAMIEALGSLAEAYGTLAEYRGALVSLDALAGSSSAAP